MPAHTTEPLPATENAVDAARDLDIMPTRELVSVALEGELAAVAAIASASAQISDLIDMATNTLERGGRLVYLGAGAGGRVAFMDAAEIPGTFGVPRDRIVALIAGGPEALVRGDDGDEEDVAETDVQMVRDLRPTADDLVIGLSASGTTPFVLAGLKAAIDAGARTSVVVNNPNTPAAAMVGLAIEILSGPELIAGSTRLKAGTVQKIVLNLISTAAFARAGYTYGNVMVGAPPVNDKLRGRAVRSVSIAARVDIAEAERALAAAGQRSRVAVVMLRTKLSAQDAAIELARDRDRLRHTLRRLGAE